MIEKPKGKPKRDIEVSNESCSQFVKYLLIIVAIGISCSCVPFIPVIGATIWATMSPIFTNSCEHYLANASLFRIQEYHQGLLGTLLRYESTTDSGLTWTQFYEFRPDSGGWADCEEKFYRVSDTTYYLLFPLDTGYNTTIVSTNDAGQHWYIWDAEDNEKNLIENYQCYELQNIQFYDALHGSFQLECRIMGNSERIYYAYVTNNGGETWEIAND